MLPPARTPVDSVTAPHAALVLRLTLGVVFIAHGLLKVFVLTLPATAAFFVSHGFPAWSVYPVVAAEVVGGAALLAGCYTRAVALGLLPVMLGAFAVHWPNGWYFGNPHGGWEYIAVLLAGLVVQAGLGDGAFALGGLALTTVRRRIGAIATAIALAGTATALLAFPARREEPPTAAAEGITLARRYFEEVWNQGKVEVLDDLLAADYLNHTPSAGSPAPGPNGLKPIVLAMRRAFPDLHFTIEDVVATPDAVAVRTTMTGTHDGDLFGVAPTHRRVRVTQIQIERLRDGRIVEHWRVTDELTLMRQLGVVP